MAGVSGFGWRGASSSSIGSGSLGKAGVGARALELAEIRVAATVGLCVR
jgi:hypothetical protein